MIGARRGPFTDLSTFVRLLSWTTVLGPLSLALTLVSIPWLLAGDSLSPTSEARLLWRATIIVSAIVAGGASLIGLQLVGQPFGRMLPGSSQLVARGVALVGILVSVAMALVHVRTEGAADGAMAFGVAMVVFVAAGGGTLPAIHKVAGGALAVLLIVVLVEPSLAIGATAGRFAWVAAAVAIIVGAAAAKYAFSSVPSVGTEDLRADRESVWTWTPKRLLPWPERHHASLWTRPLSGGGVGDWLRAAWHERSGRGPYPATILLLTAVGTVAASGVGVRTLLLQMILFNVAVAPPPLDKDLLYPVSRDRRVQLELLDSVLTSVGICSVVLIVYWLSYAPFAPLRAWLGDTQAARDAPIQLIVGVAFALGPALRWGPVRSWLGVVVRSRRSNPLSAGTPDWRPSLAIGLVLVVPLICALTILFAATLLGPARGLAATLTLSCLTYFLYWRRLQGHFATADLA